MDKRVSVIVPIYNTEQYIEQCLKSICSQTYRNLEILLINDGSTDGSGKICLDYAKKDDRITVINKKNGGNTSARKEGVTKATGEYLCFIDSDDWVEDDMIEVLVSVMDEKQVEIASSRFVYEYENLQKQKICGGTLEAGVYKAEHYQNIFIPRMFYGSPSNGWGLWPTLWGKLFVTQKFEKYILDLDEEIFYGEDAASLYPYCLEIKTGAVINNVLYHYRIREDSISLKKNPKIFENMCRLYDFFYEKFSKCVQKDILLENLKYYLLVLCNHASKMHTCFDGDMESIYWRKVRNLGELVLPEYKEAEEKIHLGEIKDSKSSIEGCYKGKEEYTWSSIWLFPFHKVPEGAKFIIFGAGYIGKSFSWQLKRNHKRFEWVAWMDTKGVCDRESELELTCISNISKFEYDFVVLAAANRDVEQKMRNELNKYGVPEEKIIWEFPEQIGGILLNKKEG